MHEETLFELAVNLPEAERGALLDRECDGNPELRARVEALLQADLVTSGILQAGSETVEPIGTRSYHSSAPIGQTGQVVGGRYTLLEVIGEGGMGSVWRAKQTEPMKRFVAVKLIKAGMDTKAVLARFEAERQALAMMDHPNIAKILDGGLHENRPFFVMELVKGTPITEFCDARKLTTQQRLELFVPVCQAIQHAHMKGIIHRDIKPSNILIALYDDKPVPKVIDFGVAKATGVTLTEQTLDTGFGGIVGTPQYMSPEQATFNNLDIDTRSDVYALGVLLYELLVGSPPFTQRELENRGLLEILRVVREEEPPRPSHKLSTAEGKASVSACRGTEPNKLTGLLKGELDWIVMMALEKDRARRYDTANGFAADVQRYLNGEQVQAVPPSLSYRLKKFMRRHSPQVIAASAILLALMAGVIGTTLGLLEARKQAEIAHKQEAEARLQTDKARKETAAKENARAEEARQRSFAESETKRATEEKQIAQAVKDFLKKKLLAQADTKNQADALLQAGGAISETKFNPTIRELLDRAALELAPDKIETNFSKLPQVQAEILQTVGTAYNAIGEPTIAIDFLTRAETLFRQHLGPDRPESLEATNELTISYQAAGKWDLALSRSQATLLACQEKLGLDHPTTIDSMTLLASCYRSQGQLDKCLQLSQEILAIRKAKSGIDHPFTLFSMNELAVAQYNRGQIDEAIRLFEETVNLSQAKLGSDHPETLLRMSNLAVCYSKTQQFEKGRTLLEEILKTEKARLAPDDPQLLSTMQYLVEVYRSTFQFDKATSLGQATVELRKAKLGLDHPDTLQSMNTLAVVYSQSGKVDLALSLHEEAVQLLKAKLGLEHRQTLLAMMNLAVCYENAKKSDQALKLMEEAFAIAHAKLGRDDDSTLSIAANLAAIYLARDRLKEALRLCEETLPIMKAKLGPDHEATIQMMRKLADCYRNDQQLEKVLPLIEETLALTRAKLGSDHPDTHIALHYLAKVYQNAGKPELALPHLEEALVLITKRVPPASPPVQFAYNALAEGYTAAGKPERAVQLHEELCKLVEAEHGPDHAFTLKAKYNLVMAHYSAGKFELALPLQEQMMQPHKNMFGPEHHNTLACIENLGRIYCKLNMGAKAAGAYVELVDAKRKQAGKDDLEFANFLIQSAIEMMQVQQYAVAEGMFRECLAIREKAIPDEWRTFSVCSALGEALCRQKKYEEAESLLLKGYRGLMEREQAIPTEGKPRIPSSLDYLIELYTEIDKPDEVTKYRDLRAKYSAANAPEEKK